MPTAGRSRRHKMAAAPEPGAPRSRAARQGGPRAGSGRGARSGRPHARERTQHSWGPRRGSPQEAAPRPPGRAVEVGSAAPGPLDSGQGRAGRSSPPPAAAAHANLTGRERRRPAGWRVSCGLPGPSNCRDFPGKHAGPAAKLPAHRNRQLQGSSVQKTGESRPGQVHLPKNWKCVFKAKLKQFWSNKAKSNICDKLCPQL